MEPAPPVARTISPQGLVATYLVRRATFLPKLLPHLGRPGVLRWMRFAPYVSSLALAVLLWRFPVDFFPFWWSGIRGHPLPGPFDQERFFVTWLFALAYAATALATSFLYLAHILSNPALDARSQTKWILAVTYGFPVGMPLYWEKHVAPDPH